MRSFKHRVNLIGLALFMVIALSAGQAAAQVPKPNVFDGGNRWLITAFDDSSTVHAQWATQGICFRQFGKVSEYHAPRICVPTTAYGRKHMPCVAHCA